MKVITVKVMGQSAQVFENFEGATVADVKAHMGLSGSYTVNVNGQAGNDDTTVGTGAYIVLAPAVKGA